MPIAPEMRMYMIDENLIAKSESVTIQISTALIMMMGMGLSSLAFAFVIENVCPVIGIFNIFICFSS